MIDNSRAAFNKHEKNKQDTKEEIDNCSVSPKKSDLTQILTGNSHVYAQKEETVKQALINAATQWGKGIEQSRQSKEVEKNFDQTAVPKEVQEYDYPALQEKLQRYLRTLPETLPNNEIRGIAKGLRDQLRKIRNETIVSCLGQLEQEHNYERLQATVGQYDTEFNTHNAAYKQLSKDTGRFLEEQRTFVKAEIENILENIKKTQLVISECAQSVLDAQQSSSQKLDKHLSDFVFQVERKRQYDYQDLQRQLQGHLDNPPETLSKQEVTAIAKGLRQQMHKISDVAKSCAKQLDPVPNRLIDDYRQKAHILNGTYRENFRGQFSDNNREIFSKDELTAIFNHIKGSQLMTSKFVQSVLDAQQSSSQKLDKHLSDFVFQVERKRQYDYQDLQRQLQGHLDNPPETLSKQEVTAIAKGLRQQMHKISDAAKSCAKQLDPVPNRLIDDYRQKAHTLNGTYRENFRDQFSDNNREIFSKDELTAIFNHIRLLPE